ncbi:MAG TPA: hypothetical protein VN256_12850 [Pyrinomonadaceae bacterium]|nr:hypothetical protein [Pyrinomonadaceae bacterium]
MKTEAEIRDFVKTRTEIEALCKEIAIELQTIRGESSVDPRTAEVHELSEEEGVSVSWEIWCRGSFYEDGYCQFPLSYLWTDGWREAERASMERAKLVAEEQAAAEKRAAEQERERRDRQTYERLKAKYETGS